MNKKKRLFLYVVLLIFTIIAVPFLSGIQNNSVNLAVRVFLITAAIYFILEIMQFSKQK